MMIRAADLLAEGGRIPGMAGAATVRPDWRPVARRIRDEATDNWDDKVAVDRFTGKGGRFVRGRGRLTAPGEITVDTAGGPGGISAQHGAGSNNGPAPAHPTAGRPARRPPRTHPAACQHLSE